MMPAEELGMADRFGGDWLIWPGKFSRTDELPGEPGATGRELTVVSFLGRALAVTAGLRRITLHPNGSQPHTDRRSAAHLIAVARRGASRGDGDHGCPDRTADR